MYSRLFVTFEVSYTCIFLIEWETNIMGNYEKYLLMSLFRGEINRRNQKINLENFSNG